jgi:hypothetical protein
LDIVVGSSPTTAFTWLPEADRSLAGAAAGLSERLSPLAEPLRPPPCEVPRAAISGRVDERLDIELELEPSAVAAASFSELEEGRSVATTSLLSSSCGDEVDLEELPPSAREASAELAALARLEDADDVAGSARLASLEAAAEDPLAGLAVADMAVLDGEAVAEAVVGDALAVFDGGVGAGSVVVATVDDGA